MKIAIFVEGQTEATFIRNLLPVVLGYGNVSCDITALSIARGVRTPRSLICPTARFKYEILISPGDGSVLSDMRDRFERLVERGYDRIVGLKDMYTSEYLKISNVVDPIVIQRFKQGAQSQIENLSSPRKAYFHHAIMETESWILAIPESFLQIDVSLTPDRIRRGLGIDLSTVSVESFLHPAEVVNKIFGLAGRQYVKNESDIEVLTSSLTIDQVNRLRTLNSAPSFTSFYNSII